ncbi:uncharacterized protein [Typha angustifolia]|uniref:uncharacterized protein n=1 Tax=Typha angustifolia TaxID=59011 RepID=UPI003C2ED991
MGKNLHYAHSEDCKPHLGEGFSAYISMYVSYKIIAKILVDRMKCLLPKLVVPEQAAFVAGRNIADNTLAAQEVVHSMTTNRTATPIMMLKLDIEKAYDWVSLEANLSSLINDQVDRGQLTGYQEGKAQLTHLLYADDLPITVQAIESDALIIQECLVDYTKLTNQKETSRVEMQGTLHRQKLTLINATIMAISTYWLGCTWLPDTILQAIEKKARTFLWESGAGQGLHLQNWNTVTSSKAEGNLAIRKLKEARAALLGKLVFKVLNRQECLWVKILRAKYDELNPWTPIVLAKTSWVWRALVNTTVMI